MIQANVTKFGQNFITPPNLAGTPISVRDYAYLDIVILVKHKLKFLLMKCDIYIIIISLLELLTKIFYKKM